MVTNTNQDRPDSLQLLQGPELTQLLIMRQNNNNRMSDISVTMTTIIILDGDLVKYRNIKVKIFDVNIEDLTQNGHLSLSL